MHRKQSSPGGLHLRRERVQTYFVTSLLEERWDKMAKAHRKIDSVAEFEKAARAAEKNRKYVLRLYVAGINPRSSTAIRSITEICEEHLKENYELEIIDIYQQPTLAKGEQIIAAPTLIKKLPLPLRRFIGDLADKERILVGLDLRLKN
jgi:circadian clock protein KaiB